MGKDAAFPTRLWDLLKPRRDQPAEGEPAKLPDGRPARVPRGEAARPAPQPVERSRRSASKQQRYDELVREMKRRHGVRVHRWRKSSSGCAWEVTYADGTVSRLIEAPYPRGPISAAVFLHEIGHHAIGFHRYKPRCYEEYLAWQWALEAMAQWDITVTDRLRQRIDRHLRYAVRKARRRGLKRIPAPLAPYLPSDVQVRNGMGGEAAGETAPTASATGSAAAATPLLPAKR